MALNQVSVLVLHPTFDRSDLFSKTGFLPNDVVDDLSELFSRILLHMMPRLPSKTDVRCNSGGSGSEDRTKGAVLHCWILGISFMRRTIPWEVRWFGCLSLRWKLQLRHSSATGLSGPSTLLSELPSSCRRAFSSSLRHGPAVEENECSDS